MRIIKETEWSSGDFKCPHCETELSWLDSDEYAVNEVFDIKCPECKKDFEVDVYKAFEVKKEIEKL